MPQVNSFKGEETNKRKRTLSIFTVCRSENLPGLLTSIPRGVVIGTDCATSSLCTLEIMEAQVDSPLPPRSGWGQPQRKLFTQVAKPTCSGDRQGSSPLPDHLFWLYPSLSQDWKCLKQAEAQSSCSWWEGVALPPGCARQACWFLTPLSKTCWAMGLW